jgi:hypothetical protein
MQQKEPHREPEGPTEDLDDHSPSGSSVEGETFEVVPQPPLTVRQPRQQAVVIPLPEWRRLQRRVETMPRPPRIWQTLAGLLAGAALGRHDESALWMGGGALLCFLADRAINRGNRGVSADILEEMKLHDPRPRRRPKR